MTRTLPLFLERYLGIGLVGCVGVVLSVVAADRVHRWEVAKDQERFEQQSTVLVGRLQQQVDSYMQLTRAVGVFYNTNPSVSLQDFETFTRSLLPYYDGLLVLGLVEKVTFAERPAYERKLESYGFSQAKIHEFNAEAERIPAQERSIYFPTTYIEPFEAFQHKVGFDSGSVPQRLMTLNRAEQLGVIVSTALVELDNGQPGIIYYYPIFATSNTDQEFSDRDLGRQNAIPQPFSNEGEFQGAIFSMYELQTWIEISLPDLNLNGLDFYLYRLPQDQLDSALNKARVTASEHFLIAYDADTQTLTQSIHQANLSGIDPDGALPDVQCGYERQWLSCIQSINIARQELSLLVIPSENRAIPGVRSTAVLLIGLLSTSFLVMYASLSKRKAMKIQSQNVALKQVVEKLQHTQAQLVQTEKMSSLGELVAGVAHEINNPLGFISINLGLAKNYFNSLIKLLKLYQFYYSEPCSEIQNYIEQIDLDFVLQDLPKMMDSMEVGSERLRQIVLSLRNFSRLDEAEIKDVDIHEGIDNTLMILSHRLKEKHDRAHIEVVKKYSDSLPLIQCHAGQINQVFMNILANAIDVLNEKNARILSEKTELNHIKQSAKEFAHCKVFYPRIEIETSKIDDDWISIQISDNGMGIPKDIQNRLFNPFFTTKPVGKGTGLGLSISYQIVNETHSGYLSFLSEPEQGTQFIIKLPISRHASSRHTSSRHTS